MSRFSRWIPSRRWLLIPPVVIGVTVVMILANSQKELARVAPQETSIPLLVTQVQAEPIFAEAIGFGTARARRVWTAVSEVGGRIRQTHHNLRSGIHVEQGQLLIHIDPIDYELRVQQRRADLAQFEAQLEQLELGRTADQHSLEIQENLLKVRESEVRRFQQLGESAAASQSEQETAQATWLQQAQSVQTLKNSLMLYPAQIAAAEANVNLAKSRRAEAERDVERTTIVAPFSGVLSDVSLEPNQYVAPGERLFQLLDTQLVEVEAQFSQAQLSQLWTSHLPSSDPASPGMASQATPSPYAPPGSKLAAGLSAVVTTRSGDVTRTYTGQPVRISESLDDQTRTLGIVIRVRNEEGVPGSQPFALRPGAYCEVTLTAKAATTAMLIPRSCLEAGSVFVVDHENRLRRREVRVGFALRDHVVISEGVSDGDLVVVNPPAIVMDGALIEPEIIQRRPRAFASSLSASETRE